jgi:ankyrin repeat protein
VSFGEAAENCLLVFRFEKNILDQTKLKSTVMKKIKIHFLFLLIISFSEVYGQNQYYTAIDLNKIEMLEKAIAGGKDINYQRKQDGYTPLMYSIIKGRISFAERMLQENCNLDLQDKKGNTALLTALQLNGLKLAKKMLDKGALAVAVNKQGYSAISYLAKNNNEWDTARLSLQLELLDILIEKGETINKTHQSPLILASEAGSPVMVGTLLEKGADINLITDDNKSALTAAAAKGRGQVIQVLLRNGADINRCDNKEYSPLMIAIDNNQTEAAKIMMESGANLDYMTSTSLSVLKLAVLKNNPEIIGLILQDAGWYLDLSNIIDNDLMASSIVYSETNASFNVLTKNEKFYYYGEIAEIEFSKMLSEGDTVKARQLINEAVYNYQKSYDSYAAIEKDYRREADIITLQQTAAIMTSALVGATTGILFIPNLNKVEGYKGNPEMLYKICDRYKLQMMVLENKIKMLKIRLA